METTECKVEEMLKLISLKRNSNDHIQLKYHLSSEEYYQDIYLTRDEIEDILTNRKFFPYYSEGYHLFQFTGTNLHFVDIGERKREVFIPFRRQEFEPMLRKALDSEPDQVIDLLPAFLDSVEKARPCVNETIYEQALDISKIEGISDYMDRVRQIAKNSSGGFDDPVELGFYKDYGPKDLYWNITQSPGGRIMNGGIIFNESSGTWGIHT